MRKRIFTVLLFIPILYGCISSTDSLSPTDTSQAGNVSIQTPLPPSATQAHTPFSPSSTASEVTSTPLPSASVTPSINFGTPIPGLEDIPIMPNAFNGEFIDELTYAYYTPATVDAVETYYMDTLISNGWSMSNRSILEVSMFSGPATVLEFQKNGQSIYIMLFHLAEDNSTAVFISHSNPLKP